MVRSLHLEPARLLLGGQHESTYPHACPLRHGCGDLAHCELHARSRSFLLQKGLASISLGAWSGICEVQRQRLRAVASWSMSLDCWYCRYALTTPLCETAMRSYTLRGREIEAGMKGLGGRMGWGKGEEGKKRDEERGSGRDTDTTHAATNIRAHPQQQIHTLMSAYRTRKHRKQKTLVSCLGYKLEDAHFFSSSAESRLLPAMFATTLHASPVSSLPSSSACFPPPSPPTHTFDTPQSAKIKTQRDLDGDKVLVQRNLP
eukprot:3831963-Rhodomonas_salina.1